MKPLLMGIVWLFALFSAISSDISNSEISESSVSDVNRRQVGISAIQSTNSLLPITPKQNTVLVAALDGTIYLVEINSRKILWSFASGSSIYSSYQARPDLNTDDHDASELPGKYIDFGDDWELYVHGPGYKKKLQLSAEEFVKLMPIITADRGIILGSKNTTVFLVDAKSGKVIYTFRSSDHSAIGVEGAQGKPTLSRKDAEAWGESDSEELAKVEQPLYITRTDYAFQYFSQRTHKELWHLKFAEIEASFRCQDSSDSFGEVSSNLEDVFDPKLKGDNELLLNCQRKAIVYTIRDHSLLEPIYVVDRLSDAQIGGIVPSLPSADPYALSKPVKKLPELYQNKEGEEVLALPSPETENVGILSLPSADAVASISPEVLTGPYLWYFIVIFAPLSFSVAFLFYLGHMKVGKRSKLTKLSEGAKVQTVISRRKKARKSNVSKDEAGTEISRIHVSHENMVRNTNGFSEDLYIERIGTVLQMTSRNPVDGVTDGRRISKLFVSDKEIAKGSNGTIVLEGIYDGRPVAVKRLVRSHHDVALKEIRNLIASDCHPNIIRWYGVEYDQDFVYLSLERCTCNLAELIFSYSSTFHDQAIHMDQDSNFFSECTVRVHSKHRKFELWKANGHPSMQLLKLMRDVVCGLAHLHELGIIHRDLKPQNVLIIKERSIHAKLSDMGISKRLPGNMSSITQNATGSGSSGWQAPEQLQQARQTRAVDLFSLGCVLFFCLTGGQHPFGDSFERDVNIVKDQKDLFLVENIPEAADLIGQLLSPDPNLRPKAVDVLAHPLFWDAEMRLSFLRDASDRVELENREGESELFKALESVAPVALGGKWDEKMESAFINDIGHYRRYKFDSVRDLLRVIRNKLNHYRELSQEIREMLGPIPEGFDRYFSSRFPWLLMEVYKVLHHYCGEEEFMRKYFRSGQI
ncbi:Non-specific serine/threonine protein kinase [Bertholletia excelsa]